MGADGATCAPGAVGDIEVKGRACSQLLADADRTREEFTDDGYFRPAIAEMTADRYLRIVGRAGLIITSGLNIPGRRSRKGSTRCRASRSRR